MYLTSLANCSPNDLPDAPENELLEQKAALQAELEDLHSEISAIAEMVVEHDLRKPILDAKERKDRERTQARSAWLKYVCHSTPRCSLELTTIGSINAGVHGQTS